jgi:hypothetical protein
MIKTKQSRTNFIFFGMVLSLGVFAAGGLLWARERRIEASINSFESCSARYPVMTSYPEQCRTKGGKHFVNDIGNELSFVGEMMVQNPRPNQTVMSPIIITGRATGPWFFEGQFNAELVDEQGEVIGEAVVQAIGDWMTSDLVPFEARIDFVTNSAKGKLILRNANPSGLPEKSKELIMPLKFGTQK